MSALDPELEPWARTLALLRQKQSTEPAALLPCPFCGAEADFSPQRINGFLVHWALCGFCGARAVGLDATQATKLWNRRQPAPAADPQPTGTEAAVCEDIRRRQQLGVAKYGTTVADNPLSRQEWLRHAYQEALDLAVYLRRLIDMEPEDAIPREQVRSIISAAFNAAELKDGNYDLARALRGIKEALGV